MSDMADLFARDPLSLTETDITEVVELFRKSRELYISAAVRTKSAAVKRPVTTLNLGDLDL